MIQAMLAAVRRRLAPSASNDFTRSPSPSGQADNRGQEAHSAARSLKGQPWKLAGWLVVVMLSLMLLAPVLLAIALIVPMYLAHEAGHDARAWQATAARLTMTFDEDLPIADIQIDGASNGPIEISPIERLVSAGPHTITVVYTHGDRKRSVRKTIKLAPNENRTLDLTPLVVADMEEREGQKIGKTSRERNAIAPKVVHAFTPSDEPLSADAKWVGDELEVTASEAGPVPLFEVPLDRIDESVIAYRFRIKADNLASSAWADMWCRVPGFGELLVRRFEQKVQGATDWKTVETPFIVHKDQFADTVKLMLVFEGPGKMRMKDIQVLVTPLDGGGGKNDAEQSATEALAGSASSDTSSAPRAEVADMVWGKPVRDVQLGWRIEPKKETYRLGELITVSLFLRNVGQEPIGSSMPRTQILEKLGLDVDLRDAENLELPWKWGHAYTNAEEVSGAFAVAFEPKVPYALPPFIVAIGKLPKPASSSTESVMVELTPNANADELPHQPLGLAFKLSSYGYEHGDEAELQSAAFDFRVMGPQ